MSLFSHMFSIFFSRRFLSCNWIYNLHQPNHHLNYLYRGRGRVIAKVSNQGCVMASRELQPHTLRTSGKKELEQNSNCMKAQLAKSVLAKETQAIVLIKIGHSWRTICAKKRENTSVYTALYAKCSTAGKLCTIVLLVLENIFIS